MNDREMRLLDDKAFIAPKNTLVTRNVFTQQGIFVRRRDTHTTTTHTPTHTHKRITSEYKKELMWQIGVYLILEDDTRTLKQIGYTILYMLGLHFALRVGTEHRNLSYVNFQLAVKTD